MRPYGRRHQAHELLRVSRSQIERVMFMKAFQRVADRGLVKATLDLGRTRRMNHTRGQLSPGFPSVYLLIWGDEVGSLSSALKKPFSASCRPRHGWSGSRRPLLRRAPRWWQARPWGRRPSSTRAPRTSKEPVASPSLSGFQGSRPLGCSTYAS